MISTSEFSARKEEKKKAHSRLPPGSPREICQNWYWSPLGNNLTLMLFQVDLVLASGGGETVKWICHTSVPVHLADKGQKSALFLSCLIMSHPGGHPVQADCKFWDMLTLWNMISWQVAPWKLTKVQWKDNRFSLELKKKKVNWV